MMSTLEHDQHTPCELAQAASCYLAVDQEPLVRLRWPFAPVLFLRESFPRPSVKDMAKGESLAAVAIDQQLALDAESKEAS